MYNKQKASWNHQHVLVLHFLKNICSIMQTLQDKWRTILKPYVLLPYRWNTKPHIRIYTCSFFHMRKTYGPRQANLVLIAYASSEGSGEPAHPRSLARTFAALSYKQWIKRNLQTESHIPGPSEWLGMRSWNLSWRNARRHKFAWRGPYLLASVLYCQDGQKYTNP